MHSTKIVYMYRDADNYKQFCEVVLSGAISAPEKKALLKTLNERQYFIPSQVGLPDLQEQMNSPMGDCDHVWHELQAEDIKLTDEKPTGSDTDIHGLVLRFKSVRAWDVIGAMRTLGIPLTAELRELKMLEKTPYKKLPLLINRKWVNKANKKRYQQRIAEGA